MVTDQASGGARHTRNMGVLPATPSGGGGVGNTKNLAIKYTAVVLKIAESDRAWRDKILLAQKVIKKVDREEIIIITCKSDKYCDYEKQP